MLIELNGLSFHLRITTPDAVKGRRAFIVDEAFMYEQMSAQVHSAACVLKLIEDYCGLRPDEPLINQINDLFTPIARAA